jgi:hypothetical protein
MASPPHAIVSVESRTVPGGAEPAADPASGRAERIFSGVPSIVVNVPGHGSNARIWRSMISAGLLQSIRPSSRDSFAA